jgi:ubiquinone/menaquinone biosynthesis C-methylase UbiE
MTQKTTQPPNTVAYENVTLQKAHEYGNRTNKKRTLYRRYRMQRLDIFEKTFAQHLFDMVGTTAHIVDVPCGNGRFCEVFSKADKLTMVDYSTNMLKVAEERFHTKKNIRFLQADITSIPLPDASADLCFCMRLFQHMKTDKVRLSALNELARISSKYVALSFYNTRCIRYYRRKLLGKTDKKQYITFPHIVDLAKQAGLELVRRFPKVNLLEQQCLVVFRKI